jgi:quercetin dioxygenase-like cupin family protein
MNNRTRLLVGAVAAACSIVGIALATPIVGLNFKTILASGTINTEVSQHVLVELPATATVKHEDDWSAKLITTGPSNFVVQDVSYFPGGHTGWHSHPGILLSTVTEGSIEWYNSNCERAVYNVGDSLTESTEPHYVRNVGSVNARFMVTYVIANGQPLRIDQPAPACAAALGLE